MAIDEDELNDARDIDTIDGDYYLDEDVHLRELIQSFEKTHHGEAFVEILQAVRRAHRVKTTDLVDNKEMMGARVTFIDGDGEPHKALVMEPHISESLSGMDEAYDPRKGEMVDPSEYPLGTVQLVYGSGGEFGEDGYFFDRLVSDSPGRGLEVATSVTPATHPRQQYAYYAGWDYYDELLDAREGEGDE